MIPVFKPSYNIDRILTELRLVFKSGWTGLGPKTLEFEQKVSQYIDIDFAIFVNSCTSALHLAICCLNLPKGSKIAVPDITFVSTAASVLYAEHTPVLIPVDESLCIDLDYLEQLLHYEKISAVIPVHYSGNCCDMNRLLLTCRYHRCKVIEDCAHAFGSIYGKKKLGTLGKLGCFSFHSVKNLPICDGGMVVTNNEEYYEKLKKLRWMGIDKSTHDRNKKSYTYSYDIGEIGYKYHGNDVLATIGLVGLEDIEEHNEKRRSIYNRYLKELPNLVRKNKSWVKSAQHLVSIDINNRDAFIDYMQQNSVSIGVHYKPLSSFSVFQKYATEQVKKASRERFESMATLPCYPDITEEELNKVINLIKKFCSQSD